MDIYITSKKGICVHKAQLTFKHTIQLGLERKQRRELRTNIITNLDVLVTNYEPFLYFISTEMHDHSWLPAYRR
jgi:hypothetical protein